MEKKSLQPSLVVLEGRGSQEKREVPSALPLQPASAKLIADTVLRVGQDESHNDFLEILKALGQMTKPSSRTDY
ncbi:MAG: hypothetical protein WCG83_07370 [Candidatus Peregrinibacteria bacterium]